MSQCKCVLVVDDDESVRSVLTKIMRTAGYAVVSVGSGQEALMKFEEEHFDVVVTDQRMPGMTGLALSAAIKALNPCVPVILFTAFDPWSDVSSVDLVLHKPCDMAKLIPSIEALFR